MEQLTIQLKNIQQNFGAKEVLAIDELSVYENDRIGIIGGNGEGKSTLLKIIHGDLIPEGEVQREVAFNYYPQIAEVDELLNIDSLDWALMSQFDVPKNNLQTLSGGESSKFRLAQILSVYQMGLLLDEPTTHLDQESVKKLVEELRYYYGTLLFVSHDRYFLNEVSSRIIELDRGKLTTYTGNYEAYIAKRAENEVIEQKQQAKQQSLYKKELAWMRAGVKARSTKQQARKNRFNDLEQDVKGQQHQDKASLNLAYSRLGKQVFELEHLTKRINDKTLFEDITQIIQSGQQIGIVGPNGAGKTTLLNILSGEDQSYEGNLKIGQTVKVAYFKQTEERLDRDIRMIDYLREESEVAKEKDGTSVSITQLLERFLFPSATHGKKIYKLSGGEQKRLYLLKLLVHQPNVLLLDEPTNDLDTETLTILEDYVETFGGAVITVSHDRYFLNKVAQEYWYIHDGKMERIIGTFEDYEAYKKEQDQKIEQQAKQQSKNKTNNEKKKKKGLSYKEQKEYETIIERIDTTEQRLEEIDEEMVAASSDYAKIKALNEEQKQLNEQYETDISRWSELEELKEQ